MNTAQHSLRPHLIEAKDITEKTPLDYAIQHAHLDIMKELIEHGATADFYQRNMLIQV